MKCNGVLKNMKLSVKKCIVVYFHEVQVRVWCSLGLTYGNKEFTS